MRSRQDLFGTSEKVGGGIPLVLGSRNDRSRKERKDCKERLCVHVERRLWRSHSVLLKTRGVMSDEESNEREMLEANILPYHDLTSHTESIGRAPIAAKIKSPYA